MLLSVLPSVFGLYFYLEGSEQKCFSEELPKETIVTGTMQHKDHSCLVQPLQSDSLSRLGQRPLSLESIPTDNGAAVDSELID